MANHQPTKIKLGPVIRQKIKINIDKVCSVSVRK